MVALAGCAKKKPAELPPPPPSTTAPAEQPAPTGPVGSSIVPGSRADFLAAGRHRHGSLRHRQVGRRQRGAGHPDRAGEVAGRAPERPRHGRRPLRRARHARIQPRAGRSPRRPRPRTSWSARACPPIASTRSATARSARWRPAPTRAPGRRTVAPSRSCRNKPRLSGFPGRIEGAGLGAGPLFLCGGRDQPNFGRGGTCPANASSSIRASRSPPRSTCWRTTGISCWIVASSSPASAGLVGGQAGPCVAVG